MNITAIFLYKEPAIGLHHNKFRMPEVREATWCCSLPSISSDLVYWSKTHTVLIIALSLLKDIFSLPLSGHIGTNNLLTEEEAGQAQLAQLLSSFEAAWEWFILKTVWFSLAKPREIYLDAWSMTEQYQTAVQVVVREGNRTPLSHIDIQNKSWFIKLFSSFSALFFIHAHVAVHFLSLGMLIWSMHEGGHGHTYTDTHAHKRCTERSAVKSNKYCWDNTYISVYKKILPLLWLSANTYPCPSLRDACSMCLTFCYSHFFPVEMQPYVNFFILKPGMFTATHRSIIQTAEQAKATEDST